MLNKILPHIVAIVLFYLIGTVFFFPVTQGKKLFQTDISQSNAMAQEIIDHREKTGKRTYWNGGMFSGMPWGMLTYGRDMNATKSLNSKPLQLWQNRIPGYLFLGMLSCYLVLVLLKINPWLSILGAVAFAYNTNYVILMEVGHMTKIAVCCTMPLIFGGSLLAFRKQYILGSLLFGIGCSLALYHNHIQMMYYLVLAIVLFYLIYIPIKIIKGKEQLSEFFKPILYLGVGAVLALASGSAQLFSSQNFGDDTMRGKPILATADANTTEATSSSEVEGLEWEYVNQWSNEWKDLAAILIPRFVGGGSGEEISPDGPLGPLLRQNGATPGRDGNYTGPGYWGSMIFTSGPSYFGAVVLLLLVFSLFYLEPAMRWGILACLLLGLFVSMGKNAAWIVRPLYDYMPLFNKFRAHSSMLSMLPVFLVIPAFLGIQNLVDSEDKQSKLKGLYIAAGVLGGFCLVMALIGPGLYSFLSPGDARYDDQIKGLFIEQRQALFRGDAYRSFLFILTTTGLLWAYLKGYFNNQMILFGGLGLLIFIDLFAVNRRYVDEDNFQTKTQVDQGNTPRPVDNQIFALEPNGRGYYRVLDLSINTFNSASSSVHHNTIGGYYPAKLQRYQDIVDNHINRNNTRVLNMLNTKYFISQQQQLQANPGALGNAWFVDSLVFVQSAKEEIEALNSINPGNTAVIFKEEFAQQTDGLSAGDGIGSIELTDYAPNRLVYTTNSSQDQLAVFSEVWFGPKKGWTLTIDGENADILRANYVLRATKIPAGQHELIFEFKPVLPPLFRGATILGSWVLLLGFLGYTGYSGYQWWQKEKDALSNKAKTALTSKASPKKSSSKVTKTSNKKSKKTKTATNKKAPTKRKPKK